MMCPENLQDTSKKTSFCEPPYERSQSDIHSSSDINIAAEMIVEHEEDRQVVEG